MNIQDYGAALRLDTQLASRGVTIRGVIRALIIMGMNGWMSNLGYDWAQKELIVGVKNAFICKQYHDTQQR